MIDIRAKAAKLLKEDYQIEENVTEILFEKGILREDIIKKVLIQDEYVQNAQPKHKQMLKSRIAQKYCVSVELIEKIIRK